MIILRIGFRISGFYHLMVHAVFKSLLFLCAGIIIHLMKIRMFGVVRGLRDIIPFVSILCFYFINDRVSIFGSVLFKRFNYRIFIYFRA